MPCSRPIRKAVIQITPAAERRFFYGRDMHTPESEAQKYRQMWGIAAYRRHSPGESIIKQAERWFSTQGTVNDYGLGTGRGAQYLQTAGYDVLGIDIADNCRDVSVTVPLHVACLWGGLDVRRADWALCTDVMEHIPPEHVDAVLANIAKHTTKGAFFQIATTPDRMGALIGKPLHLTVQNKQWWSVKLSEHFASVDISGNVIARCLV